MAKMPKKSLSENCVVFINSWILRHEKKLLRIIYLNFLNYSRWTKKLSWNSYIHRCKITYEGSSSVLCERETCPVSIKKIHNCIESVKNHYFNSLYIIISWWKTDKLFKPKQKYLFLQHTLALNKVENLTFSSSTLVEYILTHYINTFF